MFNKIDVSMYRESMTKYPNGRTIFEALSATITSFNDAVVEVNLKVAEGIVTIDQAETTLRAELDVMFANLEAEYLQDFSVMQDEVDAVVISVANKVSKVTGKGLSTNDFTNTLKSKLETEIPAQLGEKAPILTTYTKTEVDNKDALNATKLEVGLLTGLLTTAKTSIVNAINELFNSKANKVQESWITPTLLNGVTHASGNTVQYMKDSMGFVHLKGRIQNTTANVSCFLLPQGYRPLNAFNATLVAQQLGSASVSFTANGDVLAGTTLTGWVSLFNISFRAEQ